MGGAGSPAPPARWQRVYADRLTVALISGGSVEQNQAMTAEYGYEPRTVLLQRDREVAEAYKIEMAPAALVIRPDGTIERETVYGALRVRQFVADTLIDALGIVASDVARGATAVRALGTDRFITG